MHSTQFMYTIPIPRKYRFFFMTNRTFGIPIILISNNKFGPLPVGERFRRHIMKRVQMSGMLRDAQKPLCVFKSHLIRFWPQETRWALIFKFNNLPLKISDKGL